MRNLQKKRVKWATPASTGSRHTHAMTPEQLIKWIIVVYVLQYPVKVIISRGLIFHMAYQTAWTDYAVDVRQAARCQDHDTHDDFRVQCARATVGVQNWPVFRAIDATAASMHSCGEESCVDLLHRILTSWPTLGVLVLTIVSAAWSASHYAAQFWATRAQAAREHTAAAAADAQPLLLANAPHDASWGRGLHDWMADISRKLAERNAGKAKKA